MAPDITDVHNFHRSLQLCGWRITVEQRHAGGKAKQDRAQGGREREGEGERGQGLCLARGVSETRREKHLRDIDSTLTRRRSSGGNAR